MHGSIQTLAGMWTNTRAGGTFHHWAGIQAQAVLKPGRGTHDKSHQQTLQLDIIGNRLVVDPVIVGGVGNRTYVNSRIKMVDERICRSAPGPSPVPLTKDLESKNHMTAAGTQSLDFA
jgi:hypothetical protein